MGDELRDLGRNINSRLRHLARRVSEQPCLDVYMPCGACAPCQARTIVRDLIQIAALKRARKEKK